MPKRDFNQKAYDIVNQVTDPQAKTPQQEAGRLGGLKGGKARAAGMSSAERSKIAKKAAKARWSKTD